MLALSHLSKCTNHLSNRLESSKLSVESDRDRPDFRGKWSFSLVNLHIVPNLLRLLYAMQPKQRNFSSFQHTVIPKGKFSCWRSVFYSAADQSILRGGYIYILSFAMAARLAFCGVLFWLVKIKPHLPRRRNQLNVNLGTFDDRMTSYCLLRLS